MRQALIFAAIPAAFVIAVNSATSYGAGHGGYDSFRLADDLLNTLTNRPHQGSQPVKRADFRGRTSNDPRDPDIKR